MRSRLAKCLLELLAKVALRRLFDFLKKQFLDAIEWPDTSFTYGVRPIRAKRTMDLHSASPLQKR